MEQTEIPQIIETSENSKLGITDQRVQRITTLTYYIVKYRDQKSRNKEFFLEL